MLFPWARAEVFASQHKLPMLAPQWTQPKIGPLLRREKDLRYYTGLFTSRGYVGGLKKLLVKLRSHVVPEQQARSIIDSPPGGSTIVRFEGMEHSFEPLYGHQQLLHRRLLEILSTDARARLQSQQTSDFIAVHVRCGDKWPLEFGKPFPQPQWGYTLPIKWYANVVREIRAVIGGKWPVKVFSDGREDQLRELLELQNVTLSPANPSIVDILLLAKARLLMTSGSSSFSLWAAFLGGMPAVWYPGSSNWAPTLRQHLSAQRPDSQPETSLQGELPSGFQDLLRSLA